MGTCVVEMTLLGNGGGERCYSDRKASTAASLPSSAFRSLARYAVPLTGVAAY